MIGYRWGGADRCDAADPTCGADGKTLDAPPSLGPAPRIPEAIAVTDVCSLKMTIGKYSAGSLRIGLFGKEAPLTTKIIKQLCNSEYAGIKAAAEGIPAYDDEYYPVSYEFAAATFVERGQRVVISQSDPEYAFCRRRAGSASLPRTSLAAAADQVSGRNGGVPRAPRAVGGVEAAGCLVGGAVVVVVVVVAVVAVGGCSSGSGTDGSRSSSGSGSGSGSGGSGWSAVDAVAGFVSVPRSGSDGLALTIGTGSGRDPSSAGRWNVNRWWGCCSTTKHGRAGASSPRGARAPARMAPYAADRGDRSLGSEGPESPVKGAAAAATGRGSGMSVVLAWLFSKSPSSSRPCAMPPAASTRRYRRAGVQQVLPAWPPPYSARQTKNNGERGRERVSVGRAVRAQNQSDSDKQHPQHGTRTHERATTTGGSSPTNFSDHRD